MEFQPTELKAVMMINMQAYWKVGPFMVRHGFRLGGQTPLYLIYLDGKEVGASYSNPNEEDCRAIIHRASRSMREVMDEVLARNPLSLVSRNILKGAPRATYKESTGVNPTGKNKTTYKP